MLKGCYWEEDGSKVRAGSIAEANAQQGDADREVGFET